MKKRLLAALLAGTLLLSTAACSSGESGSGDANSPADTSAEGESILNPPGELPIVKEGNELTLSIFLPGIGEKVSSFDYEDNLFTQKVVDETGIQLEFYAVSQADANEKLNLMLSSGEYPDLIRAQYIMQPTDMNYYASQGIFIPLDDYNLSQYPNIKEMMDAYPITKQYCTASDGKMYAIPEVNDCFHCAYSGGRAYYYMPFVRDNDLEVPTTTEEFKDFLTYIRDNDVNGNGDPSDEIPIAFGTNDTLNFISSVAKYFLPWVDIEDKFPGIALVDGKVTEQYKSDEFRQALAYMNELYTENLIAPDSFTMTVDELMALGENPDAPLIAVQFCNWSTGAVQKAGESRRWFEYFVLPPMEGPNGPGYSGYRGPQSAVMLGMSITDQCENPEAAIALYNYLIDTEVQLDGYFGPKGTAWDDPDEGELSLKGETPLYKAIIPYGTGPVNSSWDQFNPMYRSFDFRLGEQAQDYDIVEEWFETGNPELLDQIVDNPSFNEINNYYGTETGSAPYALPDDMFLPPLLMESEDSSRVTDIKTVLQSYFLQTWVEFITGARDLDTEWDSYLAEVENMGSGEMVSIMQKYVDAES